MIDKEIMDRLQENFAALHLESELIEKEDYTGVRLDMGNAGTVIFGLTADRVIVLVSSKLEASHYVEF